MEFNECKYRNCNNLIPVDKNSNSIYCCPEHGAKERYSKKKENKKYHEVEKKLKENYKIIDGLYNRNVKSVSQETLQSYGFDTAIITSVISLKKEEKYVVELFDYQLNYTEKHCFINKFSLWTHLKLPSI